MEKEEGDKPSEILARNVNPGSSKIPSLAKLKKFIISRMESRFLEEVDFIHSHEVLFGDDISLAEYGVAILFSKLAFNNDKIFTPTAKENITKRCDELDVSIILYNGSKRSNRNVSLGIN